MSSSGISAAGLETILWKLVKTKFNGMFQNWPHFWSQFCELIDKSSIAGVTNFSYLRELLVPKVKASIKALPVTSGGYMQAER